MVCKDLVRDRSADTTTGVFEMTKENMYVVRRVFDEYPRVFCATPDTTFEEFCGDTINVGINLLSRKMKRPHPKDRDGSFQLLPNYFYDLLVRL